MCNTQRRPATNDNPIKNGDLLTAEINGLRVSGRWFSVGGDEWLIQPGRWIHSSAPLHILERKEESEWTHLKRSESVAR